MSLNNKQMSSILHIIADATTRMIDAVDNNNKLGTDEAHAMRNKILTSTCDIEIDDFLAHRRANHRLLIKRGTNTQNNSYIGKCGEITVDTDKKTLRVHDGQTAGGTTMARVADIPDITSADYVIAWQNPTAENNYTWYRKYKSGWVEMGGTLVIGTYSSTQAKSHEIILPMAIQLGYNVSAIAGAGEENAASRINFACKEANNTSIVLGSRNMTTGSASGIEAYWHVCGNAE